MGSKAVKTALNKSPNLKAKAEKFAKNAFENVKQTLQNSSLDKNVRTALENIFSKELIKALDSRAFVRGEKGLKAFEKANKESLAKLDIMAGLDLKKGEKVSKEIKINSNGDYLISDKQNKKHIIKADLADIWLKTFELENLTDDFIPKLPQELQNNLGKKLKLTLGSLLKLQQKGREKYINELRSTLEKPDFVLKDIDKMVIFAKKMGEKQYFTSINLETQEYFISISNAPKRLNILKNKINKGAKMIYKSPNSESI